MNGSRPRRCGFTLVELLVVIAIIGMLIGLSFSESCLMDHGVMDTLRETQGFRLVDVGSQVYRLPDEYAGSRCGCEY